MRELFSADRVGCAGRLTLPHRGAPIDFAHIPYIAFPERAIPASPAYLRQWLRPGCAVPESPPRPTYFALGGILRRSSDDDLIDRISFALRTGAHARLAEVPGDLVGCLVAADRVYLFRSLFTRDTLFYRQSGNTLEWSSDPADLVPDALDALDRDTLRRICRGDSVFAYRGLGWLRPGHLLIFDGHTARTVRYDRIEPAPLPRGSTMRDYADRAWELLLAACRPYADSGRVGLLLSGGLDSAAVAAALVSAGADVTAYHLDTPDPLADESGYARAVAGHLSIPFTPIPTDIGPGYLDPRWRFAHPYNHTGFRWLEQAVRRVAEDGVGLLTWGRDGDLLFGPLLRYGVRDVLTGRVSRSEKLLMLRGLLSSRWRTSSLIASVRGSYSLVTENAPIGENAHHTDFLVPALNPPFEFPDPEFVPEEQTTDLALSWPHGVTFCSPMADRELYELLTGMPVAYRCVAHGGRTIGKPVLRLLLQDRLPPVIWRRHGRMWPDSPHESFCMNHPAVLADLLGPDALLARLNIVDPRRLAAVLADPMLLRRNAETLVYTAMTELFLRGLEHRTPVRS
ncbi:asparagine synthase-related protein [Nocardia sp. NPDC003482]